MRRLRSLARPVPALLAVTAFALVARLWALGWRVAHQDESRVGAWILHYMDVGGWEYYPMIHGPFLPHVNSVVFDVFGASDFTARLVVAVVGGLLPLSALLLRDRLRDVEVVALGGLLALNPLLLYYSRFMRNDLPLAAFMFVAFALCWRAYESGRLRYLYAGAVAFALGVTAKELALLYPFYWLGAGALLLDHRLAANALHRRSLRADLPGWLDRAVAAGLQRVRRARDRYVTVKHALLGGRDGDLVGAVRSGPPVVDDPGRLATTVLTAGGLAVATLFALSPAYNVPAAVVVVLAVLTWDYAPAGRHLVLAGVLCFAVLVFFYAPRALEPGGVGLYSAVRDPSMWPAVVEEAIWGSWQSFLDRWAASAEGHSYVDYLQTFWDDIESGALALFLLAAAGLLIDRYTGDGPRDVVAFSAYWGFASFVTYPVIAENAFPWEMVHVVVPLAVPAAVAVGFVYRRGARAVVADDVVTAAAAALLVLLVVGQMGATAYDTSFERPQSQNVDIIQYAQPSGHMQETLQTIYEVSRENEGTDVLFYGHPDANVRYPMHDRVVGEWDGLELPPSGWFGRLPMAWYFPAHGVTRTNTTDARVAATTDAPVVIAHDDGVVDASDNRVEERLLERGYEKSVHQAFFYGRPIAFYVKSPSSA